MTAHRTESFKKSAAALRRLAIAYGRVSTDEQGENGVGLSAQRAAIENFCRVGGFDLVHVVEENASARGENNLLQRPKLLEALKEAERRNAVVIVYDWSRLTRTQSDRLKISTLLPENRIVAVEDGEDLSRASEAGKLAYHEKKGEHISRTTKEGMARKKALEGVVFGNPDILTVQPSGTAAASEKALRLRKDIADILENYGELADNLSNSEFADILNARGLRTGQNKPFTPRSVAGPKRDAEEVLRLRRTAVDSQFDDESDEDEVRPPGWGRF